MTEDKFDHYTLIYLRTLLSVMIIFSILILFHPLIFPTQYKQQQKEYEAAAKYDSIHGVIYEHHGKSTIKIETK